MKGKLKKLMTLFLALAMISNLSFGLNVAKAANTDKYLAWSEAQGSYSAAFYLGKENTQERFVAYCYNKKREAPARITDDTIYYQKTDGTPNDYGQSLYHPINDTATQETLIRDLKRVLYHGYPNNKSQFANEFKQNYIKDTQMDGLFREVIQWAVWHYTDKFDPEEYYKASFALASGDSKETNTLKVNVYKKLIGKDLPEADDAFFMDLFTTEQSAKESGNRYQNLLVTRQDMPLPKPPENPYGRDNEISITKAAVIDGKIQPKVLTGAKLEIREGEGLKGQVLENNLNIDEFAGFTLDISGATFNLRNYNKKFGDVFTLIETEAPNGYKKTEPIVFRVMGDLNSLDGPYWIEIKQKDGSWKKQEVPKDYTFEKAMNLPETMLVVYDEKQNPQYDITFKKLDDKGAYLEGAEFAIYKKADEINPIKTFITGTKDVTLKLEEGEYILRELAAPDGYAKIDEDIVFSVNKDALTQKSKTVEGIAFTGNTITFTNKKEVKEELVTLKVKKTWDKQEKQGHPETRFALFKNDRLEVKTIQTLSPDKHELVWEGIKKSEYQSYKVYELDAKNEKFVKYVTLNNATYEAIYKHLTWQDEGNNVYSQAIDNALMNVVRVDKEWQDKEGKELKDASLTTRIYLRAWNEKGQDIREDHEFTNSVKTNDYYISADFKNFSFMEEQVELQLDKPVEVMFGGKIFLATLSKIDEGHYKVVNQEKPDKPKTYPVRVSKKALSETGDELKGASLKVFKEADDETKAEPVHKWESTGKVEEFALEAGAYKLVEAGAPDGYEIATTIHFSVEKDGSIKVGETTLVGDAPIVMVDKVAKVPDPKPEKIDFVVNKIWENMSHAEPVFYETESGEPAISEAEVKIPQKVEVELYKNGEATGLTRTLSEESQWRASFEGLLKVNPDTKENYSYSVKELGETNNKIAIDGHNYTVSYNEGTIINRREEDVEPTPQPEPEKTSLEVVKTWVGAKDEEKSEIVVELYKDETATGQTKVLNENNAWQDKFTDLLKYDSVTKKEISYSAKEVGEENGKVTVKGQEYVVTYEIGKITNTKVEKPPVPNEPNKPQESPVPNEPNKPQEPSIPNEPNKPQEPSVPNQPKKQENTKDIEKTKNTEREKQVKKPISKNKSPKTGDLSNFALYSLLTLVAGLFMVFILSIKKVKRP